MMAESEEALQHNMQELNDRLEEWEMKANWQKTRVMRIGRKQDMCNVEVNGQKVEQVEVMKYCMRLNFRGMKHTRFSWFGRPSMNSLTANIWSKCCEIERKWMLNSPLAPLSPLYWIGSTNTVNASLDIS